MSAVVLQSVAALSGGIAGGLFGAAYAHKKQLRRLRERRLSNAGALGAGAEERGVQAFRVLGYASHLSRALNLRVQVPLAATLHVPFVKRWFSTHAAAAGAFASAVSFEGFIEASVRLALVAGLTCALVGSVFSNELAAFGAVAGFVCGTLAPGHYLKVAAKLRAQQLSHDLPEMLEVVALGLRSGLTFDRSLALYTGHFSTVFAAECQRAMQRWVMGLTSRENALRELSQTYRSPLLARVVEGVVRSLRFGSSIAPLLEQAASEARAEHRAVVEERVAKVPVKMMIPTASLILPAMLLLVLGPVLLELIGGN